MERKTIPLRVIDGGRSGLCGDITIGELLACKEGGWEGGQGDEVAGRDF